jgi:Tfp pilus assembly pilus retraction ATPase PilT
LVHDYAKIHARHIITYEDPIEFEYPTNLKALVSQRDMRKDMVSELIGLKSNLRQKPSLLLVQEIRQPEEAVLLLILASLGLRVITTIHAGSADAAVSSFLKWLPPDRWGWGCYMLAQHMICAIAQRLEESAAVDAKRRYVLHQVLWARPTPKNRAITTMISKAAADERSLDGIAGELRNGGTDALHITWQQSLQRWQEQDVTFPEALVEALEDPTR